MKENKAPEKIYLHLTTGSRILNGKYYEYNPAKIRYDDKIIEYTRTDAFIKKAKKWFEQQPETYDANGIRCYSTEDFEDFREYMKGD